MKANQFEKIKLTLNFVLKNKNSAFYREKYKGLKISSFRDFEKVPFLTREEVAGCPPGSRLFVNRNKVCAWCVTSGTTSSEPLMIPISRLKQDYLDLLARKLSKNKVERIMLMKPAGYTSMRVFDWNSHPKLCRYPLIMGDMRNLEMTAKLARGVDIDAIETTPTGLNFLMPYLREVYDFAKIKYIILGGEFTSEAKYGFFKKSFPNAYFDFTFGGIESRGKKGLRCDFLNKNIAPRFFHPRTDFFYFEVIDQEGRPVAESETGEMVITTLFKTPLPLVRYRTGDLVSISKDDCGCGKKLLMEVFGRVGTDSARVGGVTLYSHLIDEALGAFPGDWQMHIFEEVFQRRLLPRLVLKVSNTKPRDINSIKTRVEKGLKVGPGLYLSKLVRDGFFLPLKVEIVDGFETGFKQIKIVSHLR